MAIRMRRLRYRSLVGLARDRLDHLKRLLAIFGSSPGRLTTAVFTGDVAGNEITITGQDNLLNGQRVLFTSTGTLPAPFEGGVIYFLRDGGTNEYSVHETLGEAIQSTNAIDITTAGSGTHTAHILP